MSRDDNASVASPVTAIVLAAGPGSRFRDIGHKLTARLPATATRSDESVAARAIAAAVDARIGPVVIVTGHVTAAELGRRELDDAEHGLSWVHNPRWSEGQMTSVRTGLSAASANGSEVAVVGLADQPGIESSAWRAVADAASATSPIAVATYGGKRANPVALHRTVWELLPREGDEGARSLMRVRPELVGEVPCTGSPTDIDTTEDLRRWQSN